MAYSELVKNFEKVRAYVREFYVYGFKSRSGYDAKSARSYDDERRRIESWLGDYMGFRQTSEGKNVFLSVDSRITQHNPFYRAWKTKSFTDGDITLKHVCTGHTLRRLTQLGGNLKVTIEDCQADVETICVDKGNATLIINGKEY